MPTIETMDLGALTVRVIVNPGSSLVIALTVPTGDETGTWQGFVYADERRTAALATFGKSTAGQVVTFTLSGVDTAGLITGGRARFSGYFLLQHVETSRIWLDGPFIVSAGYEP